MRFICVQRLAAIKKRGGMKMDKETMVGCPTTVKAVYDVDDKPPLKEAVPLGLQHVYCYNC